MSIESRAVIKEGTWVKGTSVNDERFRGYVESMSADGSVLKVHVIVSDNPEAQGRVVEALNTKVEALPDHPMTSSETLRALIDVALSVHDEAWFRELVGARLSGSDQQTEPAHTALDHDTVSRLTARW